jgi:hypothetical protein
MSKRTVEMALATPGVDAQGRPSRIPLHAGTEEDAIGHEHLLINLGPQHPACCGSSSNWTAKR